MKTIHIEAYNKQSVQNAIKEVKSVKHEWILKSRQAEKLIAEELAKLIDENIMNIQLADDVYDVKTHQKVIRPAGIEPRAHGHTVTVYGTDVAFIEFGAGIYHNSGGNTNPLSKAVQFDTTIGSFGMGQGNKPYWFIARNLISHGTPMSKPIANAIEALKPQIPTLVRQVFT